MRAKEDATQPTCNLPSSSSSRAQDLEAPTPLPMTQLMSVFLIQLAEPLTATVIYPFINQLVRDTGITGGVEEKTGYYAGVIESAFFFSECITCILWGHLSDRFGRRPTLLCAPLGLTISMLLFGSSKTFWPLVMSRCLQGAFNGNLGVAKTVIAELTDSTNRGDAYAILPMLWNLGLTVSPAIGGVFANPAEKWPYSLGRISYLRQYPYFLPCLLAATFSFVAFVVGFLALRETLPSKISEDTHRRSRSAAPDSLEVTLLIGDGITGHYGTDGSTPTHLLSQSARSPTDPYNQVNYAVFTPAVTRVLTNLFFLSCLEMANLVLVSLMYSTPLEFGGLGLDAFGIGIALGIFGFFNSLIQAKFLGRFIRKYGARKLYIMTFPGLLGCFGMYPILRYFAWWEKGVSPLVVAGMLIQFACRSAVSMAFGSCEVVLIESVPESGPLATVISVAQMLGSGIRTVAPMFASSLFSLSLEKNLAGGNLVYYILMAMTLIGIRRSFAMPSNRATSKKFDLST